MFSKTCEYAIKIMIYISSRKEEENMRTGLDEIAEAIDSPKAFTAKILQQLAKAGILESVRGRSGGFSLPPKKTIALSDVIVAIDGDKLIKRCVLGFRECSDLTPCPIHHRFKPVRLAMTETFESTSLEELKGIMEENKVFLIEP
ncbi:Rrf2 family transcriptional regulator [Reichenbachiella sp.]|uniref:RrF2 family transcriptional regulator n=1 Tax=Reichenbachiella sp. TaxID=2184521 RepID=UPI00329861B4